MKYLLLVSMIGAAAANPYMDSSQTFDVTTPTGTYSIEVNNVGAHCSGATDWFRDTTVPEVTREQVCKQIYDDGKAAGHLAADSEYFVKSNWYPGGCWVDTSTGGNNGNVVFSTHTITDHFASAASYCVTIIQDPTCDTHTCAAGALKDSPEGITCTTGTCDDTTCCNPTCDTHDCGSLSNKGAGITCTTGTCDDNTCCEPPTTCDTHTCAAGTNKGVGVTCAEGGCDDDTCCNPTCDTHDCGSLSNKAGVECTTGTCDDDTCCELPTCGAFDCTGYEGSNDASTVCSSGTCDATTCCVHSTKCGTFSCQDYGTMYNTACLASGCDTATCCSSIESILNLNVYDGAERNLNLLFVVKEGCAAIGASNVPFDRVHQTTNPPINERPGKIYFRQGTSSTLYGSTIQTKFKDVNGNWVMTLTGKGDYEVCGKCDQMNHQKEFMNQLFDAGITSDDQFCNEITPGATCIGAKCLPPECTGTCSGHGSESLIDGSCVCTCDEHYTGDQCDQDATCTASDITCQNGGAPAGTSNPADDSDCYCDCPAGYGGVQCENKIQCTASDITCQNGGAPQGFVADVCTCDCMGPWTGADCTTKIPCTESDITCANGTPAGNLVDGCSCACPTGFLGKLCDTEVAKTSAAQVTSRKSSARAKTDKKARRQDLKAIAKDLLTVKLSEGSDLKTAIRETRVDLVKDDFSHNMKKLLVRSNIKMAVGPSNDKNVQDDCEAAGAAADASCGMLDLNEDADDEQTLISTAGQDSYTIVVDGDDIISKQIETADGFDMQCWDTDKWGDATSFNLDENSDAADRLYACNGRVLVVGSQGAICTDSTCSGHGACQVVGDSYVCVCDTGFEGTDCSTSNQQGTATDCQDAIAKGDRITYQNLNCACTC